ncbi:MAG: hypothetical protein AWU59_1161 [Methanolobus sp. T82-4]|nr:MAG: hypothetical protein AWU59_1161 [Methanolobus sp. T82-4]
MMKNTRNLFISSGQKFLRGKGMVHETNRNSGTFAHIVQSLPDYSEIIILILVLALLWMSSDEIAHFVDIVRDAFIYRGGP